MEKKKNNPFEYIIILMVLACVVFIVLGISDNLIAEFKSLEAQQQGLVEREEQLPTPTFDYFYTPPPGGGDDQIGIGSETQEAND